MRALYICLIALTFALPAHAQETSVGFGTVSADPDDPVEVTAEKLDVSEQDGTAIFTGDVVIVQGEMRLYAPLVRVIYDDVSGDVTKMEARNGVTLISGEEAAEGDNADYDVDAGVIVMTGNVLMTQGRNALTSERADIDLNENTAVMKGRVKTVLHRGENNNDEDETSN